MNEEEEQFDDEKHSPPVGWHQYTDDLFYGKLDLDDPTPAVYKAYLCRYKEFGGTDEKLKPEKYDQLMKKYYELTAKAKKKGWTRGIWGEVADIEEKCAIRDVPTDYEY